MPGHDEEFQHLAAMFSADNALTGALRQAEHQALHNDGGFVSADVMRTAWNALNPQQQEESFAHLLGGYWHAVHATRKQMERQMMYDNGQTYLEWDDVDLLEEGVPVCDDGMVTLEYERVQRLVSEVGLLQYRLERLTPTLAATTPRPPGWRPIAYTSGDATAISGRPRPLIIAHICNDIGRWGKGFVLAVSKRWPDAQSSYLNAYGQGQVKLGDVQLITIGSEPGVYIANMIGQHGIGPSPDGTPPIRYAAVRECLAALAGYALAMGAQVHMPRIGCGLAGGHWKTVEPIINEELSHRGVLVTVYDYP